MVLRARCLHLTLLAAALLLPGAAHAADVATVADCTEGDLDAALADVATGGMIRFACDGTIVVSKRHELARDVTIDGSGHDVTIDGADTWQLFALNGSVTATFRHLTLAHGSSQDQPGGGAILNFGNLVVDDVHFAANHAFDYGGAIFSRQAHATLSVTDSTFQGNYVSCPDGGQGGGAIAVIMGTTATIDRSVFVDNVATGGASGGAILGMHTNNPLVTGPIEISDSYFEGNRADSDRPDYYPGIFSGGGGVAVFNHELTIRDSEFVANSSSTWGGPSTGGAVWISPSTAPASEKPAHISGTLFRDNVARGDDGSSSPLGIGSWGLGGAVATLAQPVTVESSRFLTNEAARGGAILQLSGTLALTDSLLKDNTVQEDTPVPIGAGGIEAYGPATVTRSTLIDNVNGNCLAVVTEDRTGRIVDGGGNLESPEAGCGFATETALAMPFLPGKPSEDPPPADGAPAADPFASTPAAVALPPSSPSPSPRELAARALGGPVKALDGLALGAGRVFVPASARRTLRVGSRPLRLVLVCSSACRAVVGARVTFERRGGTRTLRLRGVRLPLDAGEARPVTVRLTAAQRRLLRSARDSRLRVTVAVGSTTNAHTWRLR